jgi:glycosyltransferase involved in cell wall biosynthesis
MNTLRGQRRTDARSSFGPDDARAAFSPVRMAEVEIGEPLRDLVLTQAGTGEPYARARILVRLHCRPLGFVDVALSEGRLTAERLAPAIWNTLSAGINAHLRDDGLPTVNALDMCGIPVGGTPHCARQLAEFLATAPFMSVVIATRDRADHLAECLDAALAMAYPEYEIVVVDNAPATAATAELIADRYARSPRIRYVREDRRGLSYARMCGLAHARGAIVAFTDDDVIVDANWLAALAQGFTAGTHVGCVTGAVLPREIETIEQQWCEERGGFTKGFARRVFDLLANRPEEPLYPFRSSMFGTGANAAFDARVLGEIGGLDVMMGAGTPTRGGEDLDIYFRIVNRGYQLVYEPAALVYHLHHRAYRALRNQSYSYGVALTAYVTKCVVDRPRRLFTLARGIPHGLWFAVSPRSPKNRNKRADYPRELTWVEIRGMLRGPFAYLESRRANRRMTHEAS